VKLLLDTHVLVWLSGRAGLLRPQEEAVIAQAETMVASVVSLWELRLKWNSRYASGERKGPVDPHEVMGWIGANALELLPLTGEVAIAALDPRFGHTDPFDELLLVHAQQAGCRLLTRDGKLAHHPVALIA
jgi:PIN domain nuclease of toxin-antitoxin system